MKGMHSPDTVRTFSEWHFLFTTTTFKSQNDFYNSCFTWKSKYKKFTEGNLDIWKKNPYKHANAQKPLHNRSVRNRIDQNITKKKNKSNRKIRTWLTDKPDERATRPRPPQPLKKPYLTLNPGPRAPLCGPPNRKSEIQFRERTILLQQHPHTGGRSYVIRCTDASFAANRYPAGVGLGWGGRGRGSSASSGRG